MTRPGKIALLVAGLGLAGVTSVLSLTAHAATTSAATTTTATTSTSDISPPMRGHHDGQRLAQTAKLFGITTTQLQTELQSGKEMYQIAAAHGLTYDKMKANAETQQKAKLDDMVKVGYLTQTEADSFLKQWQTNAVNSPMLGPGFGGHGHGMMD